VLLFYILRSGLWRALDAEKFRLFFGWTRRENLSRQAPLWRHIPWAKAIFSPSGARDVFHWLEYRVKLYDGEAG
jgi:hypothetical protein